LKSTRSLGYVEMSLAQICSLCPSLISNKEYTKKKVFFIENYYLMATRIDAIVENELDAIVCDLF